MMLQNLSNWSSFFSSDNTKTIVKQQKEQDSTGVFNLNETYVAIEYIVIHTKESIEDNHIVMYIVHNTMEECRKNLRMLMANPF